jgi:hypothetical protein
MANRFKNYEAAWNQREAEGKEKEEAALPKSESTLTITPIQPGQDGADDKGTDKLDPEAG